MNGNSTAWLENLEAYIHFSGQQVPKTICIQVINTWEQTTYMAKFNIFYILWILKNLKIKLTVVTTNNHPADPLEPTNVPPSDPVASTNIPQVIQRNLQETRHLTLSNLWTTPRPGTGEYWKMQMVIMVRAPKENPWLSAECWLTLYKLGQIEHNFIIWQMNIICSKA
jgi:hypothetical protein